MAILGDTAPIVLVGLIVTLADLVIHVIGYATPYWYKDGDVHLGLWQTCGKTVVGTACISIPPPGVTLSDEYIATRALESIALVAYVAAVLFAVLKVFVVKDNGAIYVFTAIVNLAAGVLGLIGVIVFSQQDLGAGIKMDSTKFHFSFAFCIIAAIGGFFAGVIFILAWRWVHLRQ